jgi:Fe-S-cluster containining protein
MSYRRILQAADQHFAGVAETLGQHLQCGKGCSFCCYGLFEISSGDIAVIADGLRSLSPPRRAALLRKARKIVEATAHPNLREVSDEEKEAFFDRTASTPCPALNSRGECSIYEYRPIVCRTFGLPLREGDEYIGDICELNFTEATDEEKLDAAWDLLSEDVVSPEDQYSIPEAILLAGRLL